MKISRKSIPIFLAFLCMGFGDVVGPLTSQVQSDYNLSNFSAGLITFMGFIMFGLLSVPMGIFQDRRSKKLVLILGLSAAFLGLIIPMIAQFSSFVLLLAALLLLGTGATLLQVGGNPIMRDVSLEGKYSRNLSFGQFVKAIGSISGALIPLMAAQFFNLDWKVLFPIYAIIVLITLIYIQLTPIKEKSTNQQSTASLKSCFKLMRNPTVFTMVLAIFLYVGAEVSMSAKLPNYLELKFNFDIKELGLWGTLFFFLNLMIGRFLGGVVLNWIKPGLFLIISVALSILGVLALFFVPTSTYGFIAIAVIGLGFANVFPLVFSITIDSLPDRANEISGLMVTAIIGGAIMPLIFGLVADSISLMAGFLVPALSFVYILIVSVLNLNKPA
ncbi:MAG: MFS transporter [Bacteroidetes bacterium]|jgi:fucose permease|nr:MFS transporter [Bacteroidota bacterium]